MPVICVQVTVFSRVVHEQVIRIRERRGWKIILIDSVD